MGIFLTAPARTDQLPKKVCINSQITSFIWMMTVQYILLGEIFKLIIILGLNLTIGILDVAMDMI